MAITLPQGFIISSTEPIDSRLIMTKAEMLAIKKAKMPSYYLVFCSDDQKLYIYDKSIETPSEDLGRFRHAEDFFTFTSDAAKAAIETAIENSTKIQSIEATLGDAQERTGVFAEIDVVDAKIDTVEGKVTGVETRVTTLEPKVTTLETKVGDDTSGLVKTVNELTTDVNDLEPRVEQAQEDIEDIQIWINNVKLDGGEIKATYALTETLTNVTSDKAVTQIEYKKDLTITFTANSGYVLPDTVTVNSVDVGSTQVQCDGIKAKYIKSEGKLYLVEALGEVSYSVAGVAA